MWFVKRMDMQSHWVYPCVVHEKNTHPMTLVDPYVVHEKNRHVVTPVDPYVVHDKN